MTNFDRAVSPICQPDTKQALEHGHMEATQHPEKGGERRLAGRSLLGGNRSVGLE